MKHTYHYDFHIGRYYIAEADGAITDISAAPVQNAVEKETPLIEKAASMLREYFDGKRKDFAGLPLRPEGTEFQKKVWDALLTIPYGETRSYKEQAAIVGNVKACRAVGSANGRNPISIVIPCHRVIGSDKSLTGYAGGLSVKMSLLELESAVTNSIVPKIS